MISIAIDGPAGSGKSTLARRMAKKLGFIYIDTGALYRAVALFVDKNFINTYTDQNIEKILSNINIEIKFKNAEQLIFLNGKDVSLEIRKPKISMLASKISAYSCVRNFLLGLQRNLAKNNNVLMDGRDIGTVVLPNAKLKIFLTASPEKRAERRYKELLEKKISINYETVLKEILERDHNDSTRKIAPLKQAEDAIMLDTSNLDLENSLLALEKIIKQKIAEI